MKLIELLLGGDHGNGTFTFLFIIILRYKDSTHAPMIVELQLGQIDIANGPGNRIDK
jgi:hypothetical protein